MNIITRGDLLERFGEKELIELTDREAYAVINDNVLQKAIEDAEAEAGAYLQAAGLVLKAPPKALVIKTCDIARYYLYENGVTDIVEAKDVKDVIEYSVTNWPTAKLVIGHRM